MVIRWAMLTEMDFAQMERGEPMSNLIYLNFALLTIYAIVIRRQLDRIEEKIDAMKAERKTDEKPI